MDIAFFDDYFNPPFIEIRKMIPSPHIYQKFMSLTDEDIYRTFEGLLPPSKIELIIQRKNFLFEEFTHPLFMKD